MILKETDQSDNSSVLWFNSQMSTTNLCWIRLKPGDWDSIQTSHIVSGSQILEPSFGALQEHISRMLKYKWNSQDLNRDSKMASGHFR